MYYAVEEKREVDRFLIVRGKNRFSGNEMWEPPKEVSRRNLYRQVWSEPMVKVAQKYGLSDRGLAKICQRNGIPRPPRGYWANKAAGIDVEKIRLPKPNSNEVILIQASGYQHTPRIERHVEIDVDLNSLGQKIEIPETLSNPHPLVQKTYVKSESCRPNRNGIIELNKRGLLDIRVSRESLDRALRIMDALLKALELLKFEVQIAGEDTIVRISDAGVRFGLFEKTKRRRLDVRDHDLESGYYRFGYNLYEEKSAPTGLLGLIIHEHVWSRGVTARRNWQESVEVSLEKKLPSFVRGLVKVAAFKQGEREDGAVDD